MVRLLALLVLAGASVNAQTITQTFESGASSFSIEFVTIYGPNAEPIYNIGKYEVSRDMVLKFNAAQAIQISLADMTGYGGNQPNKPSTGISWNEAARFVNWLNTSQGYQAAYKFTTSGANDNIALWTSSDLGYTPGNKFRNSNAFYFLPSRDEWHTAAYGSPSGTWYNYPNGRYNAPAAMSGGTDPDTAVYGQYRFNGPSEVNFAGSFSPWGTMAQGGNVMEWNESAYDGNNDSETEFRIIRGGSWADPGSSLSSSYFGQILPTADGSIDWGFRVASVPEPSSLSLLLVGGLVALAKRRKL